MRVTTDNTGGMACAFGAQGRHSRIDGRLTTAMKIILATRKSATVALTLEMGQTVGQYFNLFLSHFFPITDFMRIISLKITHAVLPGHEPFRSGTQILGPLGFEQSLLDNPRIRAPCGGSIPGSAGGVRRSAMPVGSTVHRVFCRSEPTNCAVIRRRQWRTVFGIRTRRTAQVGAQEPPRAAPPDSWRSLRSAWASQPNTRLHGALMVRRRPPRLIEGPNNQLIRGTLNHDPGHQMD